MLIIVVKLDLYRTFKEVAVNLSFSKAANSLFMTQSAVSQAISQLEQQLECQLFYRSSHSVKLTEHGEILFTYVSQALDLFEIGEVNLRKLTNLESGTLRIGASETVTKYILLPLLEKFTKLYPGVSIKIINGTSFETVENMRNNSCDIVLTSADVAETAGFTEIKSFEIEDVFVCGTKFRHLIAESISLEEIAKYPLIFLEEKSSSRVYIDTVFHKSGIRLIPAIELGSHDLLLHFAKINLGISCVVKQFSEDFLKTSKLFELKLSTPIPKRSIVVSSLKPQSLSVTANAFISLCL